MTQELTFLDNLSSTTVNIRKQKFHFEGGKALYAVEKPWRRSFENSAIGRSELPSCLQEPYYSAVMDIWGDSPTVEPLPESDLM